MPSVPQAIIFFPGLGEGQLAGGGIDQTANGIASRLVDALNRTAGRNEYAVSGEGREEEYIAGSNASTTSVRTIARITGGQTVPVYNFYQFHYNRNLTRSFDNYGVLWKIIVLAGTLLVGIPLVKRLFTGKAGKTFAERFQLFYASGVLGLLCLYLIILAWALVDQTCTLFQVEVGLLPSSGWAWFDRRTQDLVRLIGWLAVLLTFVGLTWSSLSARLSQAATFYLCAVNYLRRGHRRATLTGQFDRLLTHVDEKNPGADIHVMAYSFGSVVAIDALFPRQNPPKITGRVKSFVSIGCPYDMIRTYWPIYFNERQATATPRWLNVYSAHDLLGSNFRNDPAIGPPQVGLPVKNGVLMPENCEYRTDDTSGGATDAVGFFAALAFEGFRVHTDYWGEIYEGERTCFTCFIELYLPPPPTVAPPTPPVVTG